jgi:hypothetical protein
MKRALWILILVGALLGGCVSSFDFRREEIFEDISKRYGRLIRWSEFESARIYMAPPKSGTDIPLPADVRVTDYEVKQMAYIEGKRQAVQVVEISYFLVKDPRVKKVLDHQLWEFHENKEGWLLTTGFPSF